ncbi:MAG TPA: GNAT family N-acetyltransferase [Actinomycetes bacterium]|nr:GNAT family N-acetyltransferase [Actinomycetes bacterium]
MPALQTAAFEARHLPDAARLLAERHRRQRTHEPLLSTRYESADATLDEVRSALDAESGSGAVATIGGDIVGFVIGAPKAEKTWGPNIWVEGAGYASQTPEMTRDIYALAAQRWFDEGRTAHFAVVPTFDAAVVEAWSRLGFGQQHAHAVQPPRRVTPEPSGGVKIRHAAQPDVQRLAWLDLVLPEHQERSPVFSSGGIPTMEELVEEWEESFDDDRFTSFVAEANGELVGCATGCALELSSMHHPLTRPAHAGFLGFAAVDPAARGLGIGRALGETVIDWASAEGFDSVVTDWRVTNLLASRTWPRLGFRPTFLRMHRNIGTAG